MRQIDKIRELHRRFNGDKEQVIQADANAERSGEVERKSKKANWSPETYARALYYDTFERVRK